MAKKFVVTMKRGLARCSHSQRATMEALGLRKRHKSVVIADNPANRGQIMKVQHLVEVEVQG
jgi:large subunit ribosomal protein L30